MNEFYLKYSIICNVFLEISSFLLLNRKITKEPHKKTDPLQLDFDLTFGGQFIFFVLIQLD